MWFLKSDNTEECFYLLRDKINYTIGRLGADLVLQDDNSISRTHALLQLSQTFNEPPKLSDSSSKYGTYYNEGISTNKRIGKTQSIVLQVGDRVRFGILKGLWRVLHVPLVSISSCLPPDQANDFEKCINSLDGEVLQQLEDHCTHLTMCELSATNKFLCALIEQMPVVTVAYWRDMLKAAREKRPLLPNEQHYFPPIGDAIVRRKNVDLSKRLERKSLFAQKTFIFMNRKQYESFGTVVQRAGGICKDIRSGIKKSFILKKNVIVVQYVDSTQSQSSQLVTDEIKQYLEAKSLRLIPDYEIGLAVLDCSTDKYCNPSYNMLNDQIQSSLNVVVGKSSEDVCFENSLVPAAIPCTELFVPESECGSSSQIQKLNKPPTITVQTNHKKQQTVVQPVNLSEVNAIEANAVPQAAGKQTKRKYSLNDFEENFQLTEKFQSAKKPKVLQNVNNSEETSHQDTAPQQSLPKDAVVMHSSLDSSPIPIVADKNRSTYSITGFLEKTQPYNEQAATTASKPNEETSDVSLPRKRTRCLEMSDDDDDDLFAFAGTKKSKNSHTSRASVDHETEKEMFGFSGRPATTVAVSSESFDGLGPTEPFVPKVRSKSVLVPLPKPKPLPEKISTAGWLSCSLNNMAIKPETVESACEKNEVLAIEKEEEEVTSTQQMWLDSLKGGFAVQVRSFHIRTHSSNLQNQSVNDSTSCGKNFKTFKKGNFQSQQRIVTTAAFSTL